MMINETERRLNILETIRWGLGKEGDSDQYWQYLIFFYSDGFTGEAALKIAPFNLMMKAVTLVRETQPSLLPEAFIALGQAGLSFMTWRNKSK